MLLSNCPYSVLFCSIFHEAELQSTIFIISKKRSLPKTCFSFAIVIVVVIVLAINSGKNMLIEFSSSDLLTFVFMLDLLQ